MSIIWQFESWLIDQGHPVQTPSGNKSTVPDYIRRVTKVAENEGISIDELANRIDTILPQYLPGGSKEEEGKTSHSAVSSALKKFKSFIDECAIKR